MGTIFAPYTGDGPLGGLAGDYQDDSLSQKELARAQFLTWLKQTNPGLFQAGLRIAETEKARFAEQTGNPGALSGLGSNGESKTWWQSFAEGITGVGTAYLAYKGQKASIDANLARANQGLPPIDYSMYAAPTVRTQVDLSPEIMARIKETGMATGLLIAAAVGLGAYFLLRK